MGVHRVQGRKPGDAPGCRERLIDDALAIEDAGAFAIVIAALSATGIWFFVRARGDSA